MYAVVQIGSRILRSPMGTKRSVPPFFGAWAAALGWAEAPSGGAASAAAAAAVPARNARRFMLSLLMAAGSGMARPDTSPRAAATHAARSTPPAPRYRQRAWRQ